MCKSRMLCRLIGIVILAFGAGIFLTFFLPARILVVLEASVLAASGLTYLLQK